MFLAYPHWAVYMTLIGLTFLNLMKKTLLTIAVLFFISGLTACANLGNLEKVSTSDVDFNQIATENLIIEDRRKIIHLEKQVDIASPMSNIVGLKSELRPKIKLEEYKQVIRDVFDSYSKNENLALGVDVLESKLGYLGSFTEKTFVSVGLEIKLLEKGVVVSSSKGHCFNIKTQNDFTRGGNKGFQKKVQERYRLATECAIKRGIRNLVAPEEPSIEVSDYEKLKGHFTNKKEYTWSYKNKNKCSGERCGMIKDSFSTHSNWKARLFYISAFDSPQIELKANSVRETRHSSGQNGAHISIALNEFNLKEGAYNLQLTGEGYTSAPILTLFTKRPSITKDVKMLVESGKNYIVKGWVDESGGDIWIEDSEGLVVSKPLT